MPVRFNLFIVSFGSLFYFLIHLSSACSVLYEIGMLKSPSIMVELCISPFNYAHFFASYFDGLLLGT